VGESEIRVDPAGIRDFRSKLTEEVDRDLRPEGDHIAGTFSWGVPFGLRSASNEVQSTALLYFERLEAMTDLMATYVRNADIIISVADKIATSYETADLSSGARMQGIFSEASTQAERAFQESEQARRESEQRAAEAEADFMRRQGRGAT
jgi:hypothetical protein